MNNNRRPGRRGPRSSARTRDNNPPEELHPVAELPDINSFREWELGDEIQAAIAAMGIETPTPIQKLAIGPGLEGRDIIAKAETGTGKTLAFGASMIARMDNTRATVLGLVLCPTRELAQQVWDVLSKLGETKGIQVALVVGGDPMHPQVNAIRNGAQVVVGTPGRVLDLYKQRFLSFPWTEFAVLDEADEMLEIGFIDDVVKILESCPEERQTLLFSATFPPELLRMARKHTKNPVEVATAKGVASVDTINHGKLFVGDERERPYVLKRLLASTDEDDVVLVFCDRRVEVERLMRNLERTRFSVKALHGGYDQAARFRVMDAFRGKTVKVLVATDVASRGLDVKHVSHVVNYSVPRSITDYTHRSGRTGRAGRKGAAVTLVHSGDVRSWNALEKEMTWDVEEWDLQRAAAPLPKRGRVVDSDDEASTDSQTRSRSGRRSRGRSDNASEERNGGRERTSRSRSREDRPARSRSSERSEENGRKRSEQPETARTEEVARAQGGDNADQLERERPRRRRRNRDASSSTDGSERTQQKRPDTSSEPEREGERSRGRGRRRSQSSDGAGDSQTSQRRTRARRESTNGRERVSLEASGRDRKRQRNSRGEDAWMQTPVDRPTSSSPSEAPRAKDQRDDAEERTTQKRARRGVRGSGRGATEQDSKQASARVSFDGKPSDGTESRQTETRERAPRSSNPREGGGGVRGRGSSRGRDAGRGGRGTNTRGAGSDRDSQQGSQTRSRSGQQNENSPRAAASSRAPQTEGGFGKGLEQSAGSKPRRRSSATGGASKARSESRSSSPPKNSRNEDKSRTRGNNGAGTSPEKSDDSSSGFGSGI